MSVRDVIIIGAGPSGISCGIEAKKQGLDYLIIEKGCIAESIRRFPVNMTFFSTPELLELGELPFCCSDERPSRAETLEYYRRVVDHFDLSVLLQTELVSAESKQGVISLTTHTNDIFKTKKLIIATGYFDYPNMLGVDGEDLPHVSHYYDEAFRYARSEVLIIGAGNSATEAALDLYRHGANVTLVHRGSSLGRSVKYWVKPDLENRIREKSIDAHFDAQVRSIKADTVEIEDSKDGTLKTLNADFVFVLTGYRPDTDLLKRIGVKVNPQTLIPEHSAQTWRTNMQNIYIAGSVACGCETGNIFIENGRLHAQDIFADILRPEENTVG